MYEEINEGIVSEEKESGEGDGGEESLEEEGMEASHKELARDMFEKITDHLNGELAGRRAGGALKMGLVFILTRLSHLNAMKTVQQQLLINCTR